jgi:hypothetical protein
LKRFWRKYIEGVEQYKVILLKPLTADKPVCSCREAAPCESYAPFRFHQWLPWLNKNFVVGLEVFKTAYQ